MSEYQPISSLRELDLLDADDIVAGYRAGRDGASEPGSDKSKSYWHGWRNAMMDRRQIPHDEASTSLAREFVLKQRAH